MEKAIGPCRAGQNRKLKGRLAMQKYGTHNNFVHMRNEDFDHIMNMRPGAGCKIVNPSPGHIKRILEVFPGCPRFILRDHPRSEQQADYQSFPYDTGVRHAQEAMRDWIKIWSEVGDSMLGREYGFEGINEPNLDAGNRNTMDYQEWLSLTKKLASKLDTYTAAFVETVDTEVKKLYKQFPKVKLSNTTFFAAAYQFGVGWPANLEDGKDPYYGFFNRSIRICEKYNAVTCFHHYYDSHGPFANGKWLAFRCANYPGKNRVAITEAGFDSLTTNPETRHPEDRGFRNYITPEECAIFMHSHYMGLADILGSRFDGMYEYTADGSGEWRTFYLHGGDHGSSVYPFVERLNWSYEIDDGGNGDNGGGNGDPDTNTKIIVWPAKGTLTQRFGENIEYYIEKYGTYGHNGIDIANSEGTDIVSMADGTVEMVGQYPGYGTYIRIFHDHFGAHSLYGHLATTDVVIGSSVKAGQKIATMGSTGDSTGPHLHFELRIGNETGYTDVSYGHSKGRFNPEVLLNSTVLLKSNEA